MTDKAADAMTLNAVQPASTDAPAAGTSETEESSVQLHREAAAAAAGGTAEMTEAAPVQPHREAAAAAGETAGTSVQIHREAAATVAATERSPAAGTDSDSKPAPSTPVDVLTQLVIQQQQQLLIQQQQQQQQ